MRASTVVTSLLALAIVSTASALPPDEYVSGLLHQPLGGVSTFTPDGRKLTACCIGSSGEDGVEVRLHSLYGGGAAVDLTELQTPSPLAREIHIRPKGWDGTIKGSVRLIGNPDGSITEVQDFSTVGVTSIEWRALDPSGVVIDEGVVAGPAITYSFGDIFTSAKLDCFTRSKSGTRVENTNTPVLFSEVMTITGLTPDSITGVRDFVVTPVTCGGCPDPWSDVESVLITASGISELEVSEGQLRTFGLASWGLGQVHLSEECIGMPPPCAGSDVGLLATNLGSSGEDGVAIDLGPGSNGGTVSKGKCIGCSNGHIILMKLYDDESQEVGRVTETSGTGIPSGSLAPDFSAIGAIEFDVAYIGTDGTTLALERCSNGTPLEVPEPHVHCAGDVTYEWKVEEGEKVVLESRLCAPSGPITLPSGAGVSGVAALRIAPVDSTVEHHRVRRLEFVSSNATDIVIHHASASTPLYVSGLPHEFLGDISTYTIDGRKLSACCLGSSGEDGVEVRFDSVHGGGVSLDVTSLLGATGLQREMRVRPKGWDGTIKGTMRITSDPGGVITEEYDFTTSGVTEMQWRLRDASGRVLASGTEPGGVLSWGLDIPDTGVACNKQYWNTRTSSGAASARQGFFDRVVSVIGLTPMPVSDVQSIEVVPVCAGCPNSPLEDLRSFEVTADGMPDLAVTDAQLRTFGVESWGLGEAHVREECGGDISYVAPCDADERVLVADNLGSSGEDGVSIDLGSGSNGGSVSREKCPRCSNGHVTLMKLFDDEDQEVGRVAETSGTGIPNGSLAPDFSAIGSVEFDVAFMGTDGTALAIERCSNGTPLEVPEPHVHCASNVTYEWKVEEGEKVVLEARLCAPSGPITLPSGAGVSGVVALRIAPVDSTVAHHRVRRLEFVSSNATEIVIHHATASTPLYVSGLPHEFLGDISTYTIDGRKLSACCIGSSGQDGVEVRFDSLHGGGASLDVTSLLGATGLAREIRVRPKGWDGTIKGTLRIASDPSGVVTEEYDFTTSGVTEMQWRLRDAFGNVLASGTEPGGVLSWGLDIPDTGVECTKYYSFASTSSAARSAEQGFFDRVVDVTGLTPMPVSGVQSIEVVPVCAGCPNSPLEDLRAIEVTADGTPELVVTEAHLRTLGVQTWGLGGAHVREECRGDITYVGTCDASERIVAVDNLGSSGQDGVSIDFGPGSSGGTVARSKRCPDCPPGHVTLMKLYDDDGQELARVAESSNPGTGAGSLEMDFSALGSLEFDVAYMGTDGTALAVERCANNTVLEMPDPQSACSAGALDEWKVEEGEKVVFEQRLCQPSGPLTLPSGAGVSGVAAVRVRPVAPTVPHGQCRRVEFTSPDATRMEIHHASSSKPVHVSGLPHYLLGEVSSYAVDGRKLSACCIGSSGQDGVEVRLDSVHGGGASVDITPLLGATGLQREIRVRPKGWDGTIKGTLRITSDPNGAVTEEYDFTTSGVIEMQWRLLNVHGGVLAEGVEPGGVLAWGLDVPDTGVACNKLYAFGETASAARSAEQGFFDRVVSVTGLTPDPVSGVQMIEVVPVPCAGCPNSPLEDLRSVDFTGDGMVDLVVSSAHVRVTAVDAYGNGEAHIREECRDSLLACDPSERVLVVENLGSSGQDGVTLDYGPDSSGGSAARSKRCPDCPPGHVTLMKLYDDEGGETFRVAHTENPVAGQVDLTVDAAGQGATHTLATFFDSNGGVVAAVLLDSSSVISYPECLVEGTSETWTWTGSRYTFHACGEPADYTLPGGAVVNQITRVECDPSVPSSARASRVLEVSSNDPGGMVIETATATPVAIGDIDRDGDIDLVDYSIFAECMAGAKVAFAPPGQCSSGHFRQCDLDKDVDVDLGDFAEFQVEYPGE